MPSTVMAAIPSAADLTPSWWTSVIRNAGFDATVTDARPTKIGTGQLGENIRFHLGYAGDAGAAPTTIVGKFPSGNLGSIEAARMFGAYRREISFYRELASRCNVSTPAVFSAEFDPDTQRFILLMGDLAPAEQGDQTTGVTLDQARLAMAQAAKLHAAQWNDPNLPNFSWLMGTPGAFQMDKATMAQLWNGFCTRFSDQIDQGCLDVGHVLVEKFDPYIAGYAGPYCLIHNDFRPDNMAFATARGGRPITIFDWQTAGVGCGMNDVAYFMGCSMQPKVRQSEEAGLVRLYYDELTGLGVRGYSFDQAWEDYRRYSVSAFSMAMTMSMMVERTERGDAMFLMTLKNAAEFVHDVGALAVLRKL